MRCAYEFLADGKPVQLSTGRESYGLTAGAVAVLPGAGVVNRVAGIGVTVSHAVERPGP
ncbi:hypothetical protein ABZZ04_07325 [Streptomyces sp. NPDC006435]|uniref:hypothetical protein n=1 Tax=Streptomyces sp. NPDC006435 TaxID=3154300 RepID=UPI0033AAE2A0